MAAAPGRRGTRCGTRSGSGHVTRSDSTALFTRAGATDKEAALLSEETSTIDKLVRAGVLSEAAGRRQVVRLAQRLGRGRR